MRRPRLEWRTASPLIARADRPVGFTWPGMLERAVVIGNGMRDTVSLTMTADSLAATGRFWPRAAGSYTLAGGADTLRFLVTGEASWPGPEAATRVERTRLHAALHSAGGDAGRPVRVPEPVPSWLFWAFFVPTASWLWWERRRAAGKGGENGRHVTPVLRRDL